MFCAWLEYIVQRKELKIVLYKISIKWLFSECWRSTYIYYHLYINSSWAGNFSTVALLHCHQTRKIWLKIHILTIWLLNFLCELHFQLLNLLLPSLIDLLNFNLVLDFPRYLYLFVFSIVSKLNGSFKCC